MVASLLVGSMSGLSATTALRLRACALRCSRYRYRYRHRHRHRHRHRYITVGRLTAHIV